MVEWHNMDQGNDSCDEYVSKQLLARITRFSNQTNEANIAMIG